MIGIAADLLDSFIDECSIDINKEDEISLTIKRNISDLRKSLLGVDLEFLTSSLSKEAKGFLTIVKKLKAYNTTLSGVLKSYQNQQQATVRAIQRVKPQE